MTELAVSRRAVTRALITLPVATVPADLSAAPAAGDASSALAAHVEAWRNAEAQYRHFCETVEDPAKAVLKAELDAVPHYTTKQSWSYNGSTFYPSTSRPTDVRVAEMNHGRSSHDAEYDRAFDELWHAHQARQAAIAEIEARHAPSIQKIEEQAEVLSDRAWELSRQVRDYPVATLAELSTKAAFMTEYYGDDEWYEGTDLLVADIHRVAGRA